MQIITYDGKLYMFEQNDNEIEERFIERCWFIVKNIQTYKNKLDYLESLSHIWVNVRFLKATYDQNIMEELDTCSKN